MANLKRGIKKHSYGLKSKKHTLKRFSKPSRKRFRKNFRKSLYAPEWRYHTLFSFPQKIERISVDRRVWDKIRKTLSLSYKIPDPVTVKHLAKAASQSRKG